MILRSDRVGRDWLKGDSAGAIIEANLKLIEDSGASEKIETDSEALRKTNGSDNLRGPDLDRKLMNEVRNKTSIADYDHLGFTALPLYPHISSLCGVYHAEGGSRIDEDPDFMVPDRNRDDRHQVAFMKGVWELDKRHAISSSLGTLSTEGIFWGSISRAFVSTSRRDSPTATSASFTTATYLPAYFVTSSLKCSTTQRSSLSMIISPCDGRLLLIFTIGLVPFLSQGLCSRIAALLAGDNL